MTTGDLSVIELSIWFSNGTSLNALNLNPPIRIVFLRKPQNITDHDVRDESFFLKRKEMRYHQVSIPSYEATVTVRIKPNKNITLRIYVRNGWRPTNDLFDFTLTLPNLTSPSCLNVTKDEDNSCPSRDPYEFDLLPNATGHIGPHFIGIEIHEGSLNITGISSSIDSSSDKGDKAWGTEMDLCVNDKPPPTTPPPAGRTIPRQFNAETDVNYTFYATVGSCVFWDTLSEKWSARGCQVSEVDKV